MIQHYRITNIRLPNNELFTWKTADSIPNEKICDYPDYDHILKCNQ